LVGGTVIAGFAAGLGVGVDRCPHRGCVVGRQERPDPGHPMLSRVLLDCSGRAGILVLLVGIPRVDRRHRGRDPGPERARGQHLRCGQDLVLDEAGICIRQRTGVLSDDPRPDRADLTTRHRGKGFGKPVDQTQHRVHLCPGGLSRAGQCQSYLIDVEGQLSLATGRDPTLSQFGDCPCLSRPRPRGLGISQRIGHARGLDLHCGQPQLLRHALRSGIQYLIGDVAQRGEILVLAHPRRPVAAAIARMAVSVVLHRRPPPRTFERMFEH